MKLVVVCDNIRSAFNVGSIFRTADALRCSRIILCGITPTPEDGKVAKTALGAEKTVPWEHAWSTTAVLETMRSKGYHIVSLEDAKHAVWYHEITLPTKMCLVLGNEVDGVDKEVLKMSDKVVKIPMLAKKESLNVGVAFAVVGFDFLRRKNGKKTKKR